MKGFEVVCQTTRLSNLPLFYFSLTDIQSRSLYGRHVSTRFLDPVSRGHDEADLSPNAGGLWLLNCLVGVRLGLLNFLTSVCVD